MGSSQPKERYRGVSWRGILIGIILIPPNCYWIMMVEGIWHSGHPTAISLFWNVMFTLFILILFNLFLKKFFPRYALSQGEFITIYTMLCMASAIAGHDSLQLGIPGMSMPFWFATPENKWAELFHKYLPRWLMVDDLKVLKPFYEGRSSLYIPEHWRAWLFPVLWWSLFILVLGLVMISINVIIRKQWTENEKLTYPIIQLPLAITREGGTSDFFKNRTLWVGFGLVAVMDLMNGLHKFYPLVPYIRVRHDEFDISQFIVSYPWVAVGWFPLPLYPFLIALGYFLPLDLSFSIWFFYLFRKAQQVIGAALGIQVSWWPTAGQFPYVVEQSYGAWVALFISIILLARGHLREVAKQIFTGKSTLDESEEPMSYRSAFALLVLGLIFLIAFCIKAGMSLWAAVFFFAFVFFLLTTVTKVRAELGPPAHEIVNMNVANFLMPFLGTRGIGENNLTVFTLFWWLSGRGYRTTPMPHQLETFKMAEVARISPKGLVLAMAIGLFWGSLATYWATLHQMYWHGDGGNPLIGHNWGQFWELKARLEVPVKPNYAAVSAIGVGALLAFLMMFMRTQFVWWPFHPAGYALSMCYGSEYFWSCLTISSLIKFLVIRYGGYKGHRKVIPFMFGVILGEYSVGAFWSAMSVITKLQTYDFCPG